jgi:hypothetical protein
MQKMLPIFLSQIWKPWTKKNKLYGIEEIWFTRAIATHDCVMLWTEWLDFALISKATKSRYNNLLYVHIHLPE